MHKIVDVRDALDCWCKDHVERCKECPALSQPICSDGDKYWTVRTSKEIKKDILEIWGDALDGYYDK